MPFAHPALVTTAPSARRAVALLTALAALLAAPAAHDLFGHADHLRPAGTADLVPGESHGDHSHVAPTCPTCVAASQARKQIAAVRGLRPTAAGSGAGADRALPAPVPPWPRRIDAAGPRAPPLPA